MSLITINSKLLDIIKQYPIAILLLLSTVVHFNGLFSDFVYCDDQDIIIAGYEQLTSDGAWIESFTKSYLDTDYYRPMVKLSFIVDAWIGEQHSFYYLLSNLILHSLFILIIYSFIRKLEYSVLTAFLVGVVYAIHPIMLNSVAWIAGRNDIIYSLFAILAFINLILYEKKQHYLYLIAHFLCFLLSVLSKETALLFPAIMLSYLIIYKSKRIFDKSNYTYYGIWVSVWLIWFVMRSNAELGAPVYDNSIANILHNWPVMFEFISKFFVPNNITTLATFNIFTTVSGIIIVIAIAYSYVSNANHNKKKILFASIWFLALVLPGLIVKFKLNDWNDYLECRAYLPVLGLLIIAIEMLPAYLKNMTSSVKISLGVVVIVGLIYTTIDEKSAYENRINFYQSAIDSDPSRSYFYLHLSEAYIANRDDKNAEIALQTCIEMNPNYYKYYFNLAMFYYYRSEFQKAYHIMLKGYNLDKTQKLSQQSMGGICVSLGKYTESLQYIQQSKDLAITQLALEQLLAGLKFEVAKKYSDIVISFGINPKDIAMVYLQISESFFKQKIRKNLQECLLHAHQLDPESIPVLNGLLKYYALVENDDEKRTQINNKIQAIKHKRS